MGKGGKDKPPTGSLYPRESLVCFFLFIVELAAVWSMVALIYNTFTVYLPTAAEREEGLLETPVMCQTTRFVESNECSWWSCMEWCLSSTQPPDECIHVYTSVRDYGSNVRLTGCSEAETTIRECTVLDLDDPFADFIYNCKEDFVCQELTGLFMCGDAYQPGVEDYQKQRGGACKNITSMYECAVGNYSEEVYNCGQRKADCLDIEGMFECERGVCHLMTEYSCERRCKDIACDKNVIIQSGDRIFLGDCESVEQMDSRDNIWTNDQLNTLLANCLTIELDLDNQENTSYIAKDCINGTLMPRDTMPKKVNYTKLVELFTSAAGYENRLNSGNSTDIPFDIDIVIYNETKLKMNHEGCSNTLNEECTKFHREFGKDGRNYTSASRFPCYYTPAHGDFVAANLDLQHSWKIFLFMLIVPLLIFLVSCFFCILCSVIIQVDEEGHMHLKGCYAWFRKPPTEYEQWLDQHEKKKRKREAAELQRQEKEEEWMKECREEMERRRQQLRRSGLVSGRCDSIDTLADINIQVYTPGSDRNLDA